MAGKVCAKCGRLAYDYVECGKIIDRIPIVKFVCGDCYEKARCPQIIKWTH